MVALSGHRTAGPPGSRHARGWRPDAVTVLTLLVASAFVIPARYTFPPLGGAGRLDNMLGIAMLAWWIVTRAVPPLTVRTRQPMRSVVLVLLCTVFVSAGLAYQRGLSTVEFNGMDRELIGWLSIAGVLLVAIDGINSVERADVLLRRIVLLGLFVAFVADVQFFFGYDLTYQLQPPGLSTNIDLRTVEFRSVVARVYGTSLHPIEFGVLMAVVGALSTHYALIAKTRPERQWRWICTAIILGSGLLSVSRSAVVSMAIILVGFFMVWRPRMWFNGLVAAAIGLLAMRAVAPGLIGTLRALFENIENDQSIQGRTNDYEVIFPLIDRSFWFGRGPGTFNVEEYFVLDNQWLGQMVSTGIVVTLVLASLFVVAIAQAHHLSRRARTDDQRHLAHTLMLVLVVFVVASFFFDSLAYPQIRAFTVVVMGVVGGLWSRHTASREPIIWTGNRRLVRASRSALDRNDQPGGGLLVELGAPPAGGGVHEQ